MAENEPAPIRVAAICAIDYSVSTLLKAQIEGITQAGYAVDAICSDGPFVPSLRQQGLNIRTVTISRAMKPWLDFRALLQLWKLFRQQKYSIVHTHTPKAAFLAQLAAKMARVPVRMNTVHGLYYQAFPAGFQRTLFKKLEVMACRLANHVFSQSQEDLELLRRERGIRADQTEWLGNGINLQEFSRSRWGESTRNLVRKEIGVPQDAFVVGIVARMVAEKGFAELFEAFSQFRKHAPNAYLMQVGFVDRSRNEEANPDDAARYDIQDYCRFLGHRDDIARLMMAMDVFCLPSYREGYPRSVLEANAMGLPAIVTDIRGCREAVVEGINGLLVPPREVAPLTAALRQIYEDDELRRKLALNARQRAEELFDEKKVLSRILAAYERSLKAYGLMAPASRQISSNTSSVGTIAPGASALKGESPHGPIRMGAGCD